MDAGRYRALAAWFNARPTAKAVLRLASVGSVAAVYLLYGAMLAALAWRKSSGFWAVLCVPAFVFISGSALRAAINRPRPYTALGYTPLFPKGERGKSMPSRHCFSAAGIAVAAFTISPILGTVLAVLALCIAASRVLCGVHYPSDVLAGLAYGAGVALAGLWLFGVIFGAMCH